MNAKVVPFNELAEADLIVDAVYLGGVANNAADDPLNKLTRCGNTGGCRKVGRKQQIKYVVVYSSQSDRNRPDQLDSATGHFTYYGENKTLGSQLHDTSRRQAVGSRVRPDPRVSFARARGTALLHFHESTLVWQASGAIP